MNVFPAVDFIHMFIVDMVTGFIDMMLLIRLYCRIYGQPVVSRRKVNVAGAVLFISSALICRFIFAYFRPTAIPPITVIVSFLLLFWYRRSSRAKRLLLSLTLLGASGLMIIAIDMITSPIVYKWESPLLNATPHMWFWVILEIIGFIGRRKSREIPKSMYLLLGLISLGSIIVSFITIVSVLRREGYFPYFSEIATVIALMLINLALFLLFEKLASFTQAEKEKALLEQQVKLQERHYSQVEELQNQIRGLHHDMKNHLLTISALAEGEEPNDLTNYLKDTIGQIKSYERIVVSGNHEIDTIVNIKVQELKQARVSVQQQIIIPPDLKISFYQAVTILGNLLDNSREACYKLPVEERWVKLRMSYINHSLYISVENPINQESENWEDGLPVSDKPEKKEHGLGLKNIRKITAENGSFNITADAGHFLAEVVLYDV